MAVDRNDIEERRARIDAVIERLRATKRRRILRRAIVMWKRAEAAHRWRAWNEPPPPDRLH